MAHENRCTILNKNKTKNKMAPQKKAQAQSQKKEKIILSGIAVPAIVEAIMGRTGFRGEVTQVRVKILDGRNKDLQVFYFGKHRYLSSIVHNQYNRIQCHTR